MERTITAVESEQSKFITKTYAWMGLALFVSAISAYFASQNIFNESGLTAFGKFLFANSGIGFFVLAIGEIALVWWLSASIKKISVQAAVMAFFIYSVLNGTTLSIIFVFYQLSSIAIAFLATSAMFITMAVYGATTKKNLATMGRYLLMALVGIIIASALQFVMARFFHLNTSLMDFLISIASVIVFTGLTAYDSQKILKISKGANGNEDYQKVSIIAALDIYLDFINLFLALLRLFGRRK